MVPERTTNSGIKVDVDAMLAAVTPKTRMVYIANPNNPTGSYLTATEMARLHAGLPDDVLLVIDAAYANMSPPRITKPGIELASRYPNVVMTRTFSKLYGLAGLRIGWMYAPAAVCDVINRIRGPFNTSLMQQLAGAAARRATATISGRRSSITTMAGLDHGRNPQDWACGWMTAWPISC